jgi:hypothetical protein
VGALGLELRAKQLQVALEGHVISTGSLESLSQSGTRMCCRLALLKIPEPCGLACLMGTAIPCRTVLRLNLKVHRVATGIVVT